MCRFFLVKFDLELWTKSNVEKQVAHFNFSLVLSLYCNPSLKALASDIMGTFDIYTTLQWPAFYHSHTNLSRNKLLDLPCIPFNNCNAVSACNTVEFSFRG